MRIERIISEDQYLTFPGKTTVHFLLLSTVDIVFSIFTENGSVPILVLSYVKEGADNKIEGKLKTAKDGETLRIEIKTNEGVFLINSYYLTK